MFLLFIFVWKTLKSWYLFGIFWKCVLLGFDLGVHLGVVEGISSLLWFFCEVRVSFSLSKVAPFWGKLCPFCWFQLLFFFIILGRLVSTFVASGAMSFTFWIITVETRKMEFFFYFINFLVWYICIFSCHAMLWFDNFGGWLVFLLEMNQCVLWLETFCQCLWIWGGVCDSCILVWCYDQRNAMWLMCLWETLKSFSCYSISMVSLLFIMSCRMANWRIELMNALSNSLLFLLPYCLVQFMFWILVSIDAFLWTVFLSGEMGFLDSAQQGRWVEWNQSTYKNFLSFAIICLFFESCLYG